MDEDVAQRLRAEMRRSGKGLKEIVNEYLRLAFLARSEWRPLKRFQVRPRMLGLRSSLSCENIGDLLEQLEGPAHR